MAKLSTLIVALQLESAQLRQGLDEANRKLDDFAKHAERTANVLEGVFTLEVLKEGLGRLAEFVKGGADAADSMGDLAESIGVPVESLSKLAYAATFSASSTEAVGKALAKTTDLMSKSLAPGSEQAAMFTALGVSATEADGKLRATEDVFTDIAQRFAETENGSAKTALAIRLFGDEGTKLIPLLNNGKEGLAKFAAEAERTGNVITEKGAASAGQFNDALDRLTTAGEGLALRVAQDLAPSMAAFAEHLSTSKSSSEAFNTAATVLTGTIRTLSSAFVLLAGGIEIAGTGLGGLWSAQLNAMSGDFTAAKESLSATLKAMRETGKEENARINAIWKKDGPGATLAADAEKAKPSADAYVQAIDRTKKAAEHAAESQKKLAEASKKAAEESAKALDEYVKAALSLERQHAAIDRAAEKRRADGLTTDGFSDVDDALSRMVAAQKAVATMRARASEREKDGDILGADSATRKADELEALAERAGAAADAFRDMAKTAEEKAADAFDAQIAAVAALELAFDDIDRAVAERLAAMYDSNADPTAGFTNFNIALYAMSEALKREAALRSDAADLEKAGKLGEARQTLLAAEAQKKFAETASMAADALAEMDRAREAVPGELGGMLAGGIGSTTSATLQGVETGAAAGPVGAVVGGLVGLLSQSEQFQGALDSLEEIFQALSDSVGALVEPLLPLLEVVAAVAEGLGALLEALSPIVEFVARPLFEVFKGFGMVVLGLVKLVGDIINGIGEALGFKNKLDLRGVNEAMARLEGASYESAEAQQEVADVARESAGALNAPSWWKDANARFNAVENGRTGGSGGGGTVNDNSQTTITVNGVTRPREVVELMIEELEGKGKRNGGSKYGDSEVP